jgi:hypothetical protein
MIPFFGFKSGSNVVLQLDDPLTITDEGAKIGSVLFVTAAVAARGLGTARFRRFTQTVWVYSANTQIRVTPMIGIQGDHESMTFTLNPILGANDGGAGTEQVIEADFDLVSNRFQVVVELLESGAYSSDIRFGAAAFLLTPKRSRVNA